VYTRGSDPNTDREVGASQDRRANLEAVHLLSLSVKTVPWPATTNPPVNLAHLSTGDFGDSAREFVASNVNPGGSCCTPVAHF
jgi:hypothetical protein